VTVTIVRQEGPLLLQVENTGETIPAQHLTACLSASTVWILRASMPQAKAQGWVLPSHRPSCAHTRARCPLRRPVDSTVFTLRFPY
jgi:hypothetical protein